MAKRTASKKPANKSSKPARKTTRRKSTSPKSTPAKTTRRSKSTPARALSEAPLIVSISGIRGIAGDSLTPETMLPYLEAYISTLKGNRIILGHDARPSSRWIIPFIESVLTCRGFDIIFVGLAPTPSVGLLTRKLKAAGGICITASHNPIEYNGLKFFTPTGEFITQDILNEILKFVDKKPRIEKSSRIGRLESLPDAVELHLNALLQVFEPPSRQRASKAPKVIIDACNSAGAVLAPDVADAYGAVFQLIYADTRKLDFPREAEPLPSNITALRRSVVKEGADLGFAIDPDADRLAIVDERGDAIGEERTLILAADSYLSMAKRKSPLVCNLSTTMAIEDLAKKHKVSVYRSAIGEANVLAEMRRRKARIGGEGNGGVIVPQVQPGRDAATAIALILIGLQSRGGTLAEWNETIPDYTMIKDKIHLGRMTTAKAMSKVKQSFRREKTDTTDGVKAIMGNRWVHVRPSNTEPIVRVYAEAPTDSAARELVDRVSSLFE